MIGLDIIYPIASKVAYEIVINFHFNRTKNAHLRIYK